MSTQENNQWELLIREHLENPTREMHIAFAKLPPAHKWMLFAFLEVGEARLGYSFGAAKTQRERIKKRYEDLCPEINFLSFDTVLLELTEGFLTQRKFQAIKEVDWIHPSCRDLTIEELANNLRWRQHFIKHCCLPGIKLSVSIGGGAAGTRLMPLLKNDQDWSLFMSRCRALQQQGEAVVAELWRLQEVFSKDGSPNEKLNEILRKLWPIYYKQSKEGINSNTDELKRFFALRKNFSPQSPCPGLIENWNDIIECLEYRLDEKEPITDATSYLDDLATSVQLIFEYEPSFLNDEANRACYERIIQLICERADAEERSTYFRTDFSIDQLESEEEAYDDLHKVFWSLADLPLLPKTRIEEIQSYARHFGSESRSISDDLAERRPEITNVSHETDAIPHEDRQIAVERVFEDL